MLSPRITPVDVNLRNPRSIPPTYDPLTTSYPVSSPKTVVISDDCFLAHRSPYLASVIFEPSRVAGTN